MTKEEVLKKVYDFQRKINYELSMLGELLEVIEE